MCHLILALPLIALPFWLLPWHAALPVYGVVLAIAGFIYALVLKAMRRPPESGAGSLLNAAGRVRRVEGEIATVWVNSELWSAEAAGEDLAIGDAVTVVGIDGLRLHVRRIEPPPDRPARLINVGLEH